MHNNLGTIESQISCWVRIQQTSYNPWMSANYLKEKRNTMGKFIYLLLLGKPVKVLFQNCAFILHIEEIHWGLSHGEADVASSLWCAVFEG